MHLDNPLSRTIKITDELTSSSYGFFALFWIGHGRIADDCRNECAITNPRGVYARVEPLTNILW